MAIIHRPPTKCEVCGTILVLAWWWTNPEDFTDERKTHAWLEISPTGATGETHTPERCVAARHKKPPVRGSIVPRD